MHVDVDVNLQRFVRTLTLPASSSSSSSAAGPFCSLRFCTMGQVTFADNNGRWSACFCVMRRKRRRLLDYNPLTASSYWRMDAVLTEMRHDAVIGLPGTQKRVAVDAPPYQPHKFNGAWGIVLHLPPKPSGRGEATPWRKTLDALYKWTDGLLMSLPTRCMPVLMLD